MIQDLGQKSQKGGGRSIHKYTVVLAEREKTEDRTKQKKKKEKSERMFLLQPQHIFELRHSLNIRKLSAYLMMVGFYYKAQNKAQNHKIRYKINEIKVQHRLQSEKEQTRVRICKPFKEPRNRFLAWRNRFLGIDSGVP
jgi:hypothetical protein